MAKQTSQPQNPQPSKTPTQLKREELEGLTDAELDERYLSTFQTKGPEMSREQVIDAIMAHSPNPGAPGIEPDETEADGDVYKNSDGKEFRVSGPVGKDQIVVRQVNVDMLNGGMVEVPNTEAVQVYYKADFEKLSEEKNGKPSFFSETKMKVEVLSKK